MATFRELEAFAQFASDLDDYTRGQLERGQRMVEVLKQGPYSPLAVEEAGCEHLCRCTTVTLDDIAASSVTKFEAELMPFMEAKYSNILDCYPK